MREGHTIAQKRRDGGRDAEQAQPGQQLDHVSQAAQALGAIRCEETQGGTDPLAHEAAVQHDHGIAPLEQEAFQILGERGLSEAAQAGEPEDAA